MAEQYVLKSTRNQDSDGRWLYWSQNHDWDTLENARVYSWEEKNMMMWQNIPANAVWDDAPEIAAKTWETT